MSKPLRVGLLMNPVAGIGGPAALKGSDGLDTVRLARAAGSESKVQQRVAQCLAELTDVKQLVSFITIPGVMGEQVLQTQGLDYQLIQYPTLSEQQTSAEDTRRTATLLQKAGIDILLFAGGDGTARDICDVVEPKQVVLGIPCGVKMHSAVFAVNPTAAAKIVRALAVGELTTVTDAEVRDIDEQAFRQGKVQSKYYGEMTVPEELRYVQQCKFGGKEVEEIVLQEIAAEVIERIEQGTLYLVGSGSTTAAVMQALHIDNTLLGVDVIRDGQLLLADATEQQLYDLVSTNPAARILVTCIGGQGHIFGRGNQQFSARVLNTVGLDNIQVIATKTKLEALGGKPLLVDSGDSELDARLSGVIRVITGYEDSVLCRVA